MSQQSKQNYKHFRDRQSTRNGAETFGGRPAGDAVYSEKKNGKVVARHYGYRSFGRLRGGIREALDPMFNRPVKTLADMTEEEKRALEERCGAKIMEGL